jgi:hypothetical protein
LNTVTPRLLTLPEGTRAHALIARITSLANVDELRAVATLSSEEQHRLKALTEQRRDLQATDPKQRARELELKAGRIDLLANHVASLVKTLGDEALAGLRSTADSLRTARGALDLLRMTALTAELLHGSGEDAWRSMWGAAERFSGIAYPGTPFPVLREGALCPFCQQEIGSDAARRLKHFAEYVSSSTQAEVRRTESAYAEAFSAVTRSVVNRPEIDLAMNELVAENAKLGERLQAFLEEAARTQKEAKRAAEGGMYPARGPQVGIKVDLRSAAKKRRDRSTVLKQQSPTLDPQAAADLRELEARSALGERLQDAVDEIERQKRLAAYRQCIDETQTQTITRKSTELTKRLITDELRTTLRSEVSKLDFNHLAVENSARATPKLFAVRYA